MILAPAEGDTEEWADCTALKLRRGISWQRYSPWLPQRPFWLCHFDLPTESLFVNTEIKLYFRDPVQKILTPIPHCLVASTLKVFAIPLSLSVEDVTALLGLLFSSHTLSLYLTFLISESLSPIFLAPSILSSFQFLRLNSVSKEWENEQNKACGGVRIIWNWKTESLWRSQLDI